MRLSICIVTYNHEGYIEECVRSALSQLTDFDYEVVVGEDNSSDATAKVLQSLQLEAGSRLRVIYRDENMGAGENFEATLASCQTEYVAFLEGDNFWTDPCKLQLQVDLLDQNPSMPFCFHRASSLHTDEVHDQFVLPPYDLPPVNGFDALIQQHNPVAFGSMVVRRALLADLSKWTRGLKLGDWPICMMLARCGEFGYLARDMSRQRMHDNGSWSRLSPHLRGLYVLQMLFRMHGLLEERPRMQVDQKLRETSDWLYQEVITNKVDDLPEFLAVLGAMNEPNFVAHVTGGLLDAAGVEIARLRETAHPATNAFALRNLWALLVRKS